MNEICIDTGVLMIYFSKDPTPKVSQLFKDCIDRKVDIHLLKPIIVETVKHLCKLNNIDQARTIILSFLNKVPVSLIDMDTSLAISAGVLKWQNNERLSTVDSIVIAYALNKKLPFHTTEKKLAKMPAALLQRLKIVKYNF
ncbi:MAG: PIN domain-containing protein [Candidatus Sigynarchaeota archaeon]